jgi:hypothetical protein
LRRVRTTIVALEIEARSYNHCCTGNWGTFVQPLLHWKMKRVRTTIVALEIEARSYNHCCTGNWGAFVQPLLHWKLRRVRTTIVALENQWVLHNLCVCVCSLRYPACNARAPYFHPWPAPLYNIFPPYLINGTIFEGSYWTQNVCFDFLYSFCLKRFSF